MEFFKLEEEHLKTACADQARKIEHEIFRAVVSQGVSHQSVLDDPTQFFWLAPKGVKAKTLYTKGGKKLITIWEPETENCGNTITLKQSIVRHYEKE